MIHLPPFLEKYFWDTEFSQLDTAQHAPAIIGRILDQGDAEAIRWMRQHFARDAIADVLYRHRFVSPKSANFWALVLDLPKEKIRCLQKPYQSRLQSHWHY